MEISGFSIGLLVVIIWNIIFLGFFSWASIYDSKPKDQKDIVDKVNKNYTALFSKVCVCKIDNGWYPIRVLIYKCGIVFKPFLAPDAFIDKNEVLCFKPIRNKENEVEMVHKSKLLKSPFLILSKIDKEILKTLTS